MSVHMRPTGFELKLAGAILLPLALAAAVGFALVTTPNRGAVPALPAAQAAAPVQRTEAGAVLPTMRAPPAALAAQIAALGHNFDGVVGIAVVSVNDGWQAGFAADRILPQQSLRKLWVAAATLEQAEQGRLALGDPVTLTRADLTVFHQPIRKRIGDGAYQSNVAELLRYAMTQSDNAANDVLYRRVGGQAGVSDFLARKALGQIAIGPEEKTLQTTMAGLVWDDRFSFGKAFWQARDRVPLDVRARALNAYLAAPPDGATPIAVATALAKLARGHLLGPDASSYLIDLMAQSTTGPERLRGALGEGSGWTLAHKTGTGQVLGSFATAYNDVGLLRAPSGRNYAIAVMIGATRQPVKVRQSLMQAVTSTVMACELQDKGCR